MAQTKVEWADACWNPYDWHCNKVSPGCKYCYAERDAKKWGKQLTFAGAPSWRKGAEDELHSMKGGQAVFINNHSDTYHEGATDDMILRVHTLAKQRPDLIFLVLTKRPQIVQRSIDHAGTHLPFPDNLWLGVSVESMKYIGRTDILRSLPARHKFISFEPLLENIPKDLAARALTGMEWAICGGESGEKHRPFDHRWAAGIYETCAMNRIPFFFKQSSGFFPGTGRTFKLTGLEHNERPAAFDVLAEQYAVKASQPSLF